MEATDILRNEHALILRAVDILDEVVRRLEGGDVIRPASLGPLVDFFRLFADDCHHAKEEGALFPELEEAGYGKSPGPLAVLRLEHEEGRARLRTLAVAIRHFERKESRERFVIAAREYSALLRHHIRKENDGLLVLADRVLGPAQDRWLVSAFATYDRERNDVRERYRAVVGNLTGQFGV
jgi:hemerythrin-like domain-containing protein